MPLHPFVWEETHNEYEQYAGIKKDNRQIVKDCTGKDFKLSQV